MRQYEGDPELGDNVGSLTDDEDTFVGNDDDSVVYNN